jgi:hypothetical protein
MRFHDLVVGLPDGRHDRRLAAHFAEQPGFFFNASSELLLQTQIAFFR